MIWKWILWVLLYVITLGIIRRFYDLLKLILKGQETLSDQIKELEEKIDEIETNQDKKPYVNPIDL
jgi:hypothetical protein